VFDEIWDSSWKKRDGYTGANAAAPLSPRRGWLIVTYAGFAAKERQSLKIDGVVALSFVCVAAGQTGRPLSPEELRNHREFEVDSKFDVFEKW
jgi:hypothetical protein